MLSSFLYNAVMAYFNRDNRSGGRNFSKRFGGNRPVRHPQMHDATCSSCGKACQLPFKPTGDRPVYCRECFAKNGAGDGSFQRNDASERLAFKKFDAPQVAAPRDNQLNAINNKLDKILELLATKTNTASEEVLPTVEAVAGKIIEKKKRVSKKAEVAAE